MVNGDGCTVAMLTAQAGNLEKLDKHWLHDPAMTDDSSYTVAMLCTFHCCPTDDWRHDPTLVDENDQTVAMRCARYRRL